MRERLQDFMVVYIVLSGDADAERARLEKLLRADIDPQPKRMRDYIWFVSAPYPAAAEVGGILRHGLRQMRKREKLPPLKAELTCLKCGDSRISREDFG